MSYEYIINIMNEYKFRILYEEFRNVSIFENDI